MSLRSPLYFRHARTVVDGPRHDEQQVGQTVQVHDQNRLYRVGAALEGALADRWGHLLIDEAPEIPLATSPTVEALP